jgi:hypothetical protein
MQAAANIPGYGQPDCYYPPSFLGTWEVTRQVLSVATPMGEDKIENPNDFKVLLSILF